MSTKDNRIKYNLVSGIVYQVVLIVLSFLLPRLYLENFGSEVNGVLSTIKQIFTYMCLLEAGIGTASIQAFYKPLSEGKWDDVGCILKATDLSYRKSSMLLLVFLISGALLIPLSATGGLV